jgi:hypothetical protein
MARLRFLSPLVRAQALGHTKASLIALNAAFEAAFDALEPFGRRQLPHAYELQFEDLQAPPGPPTGILDPVCDPLFGPFDSAKAVFEGTNQVTSPNGAGLIINDAGRGATRASRDRERLDVICLRRRAYIDVAAKNAAWSSALSRFHTCAALEREKVRRPTVKASVTTDDNR